MGFRARLVLGLTLAVVLAASVQAAIGYTLYRAWLDHSAESYVNRFLSMLTPGIDVTGGGPRFDESRLSSPPSDWSLVRYRLLDGQQVLFEGPTPSRFPVGDALWTTGGRELGDGRRFEVALNLEEIRQSLEDYRRTTYLTLAATLILTLGLVTILFRFSMYPIMRLTSATQALSRHDFQPVRVPPGNDEVSQLARSFNRMIEEIRSFVERERSFTRYASHELRTPLSTLRAQLEALELDLLRADTVFPAVKETLDRMERILEGLLTLARTSSLKAESLALTPLVREVLMSLPRAQRECVAFQAADGKLSVIGTPELVKQALTNLLSNALVHGAGRVTVSLCVSPLEAAVAVRDEGEGVPDQLLHKLPDPFFQVGGALGGIGLGLTLVRYIAETLGGRLELENVPSGFEARLVLRRVPST